MASPDYPLHERILAIQRVVLDQLLDPDVLRRVQNNTLKTENEEQAATLAEIFRSLTEGVWSDLTNGSPKEGGRAIPASIVRRNLQREHVKALSNLVLGEKAAGGGGFIIFFGGASSPPPDARSLARMHLREVGKRLEAVLNDKQATLDDTTRAHLEECHERIGKVLNASMQVNEP
jgi:hypothetical protein